MQREGRSAPRINAASFVHLDLLDLLFLRTKVQRDKQSAHELALYQRSKHLRVAVGERSSIRTSLCSFPLQSDETRVASPLPLAMRRAFCETRIDENC